MKRVRIKVTFEGNEVWLASYKQVSLVEYKVNLSEARDAAWFDEDDYIIKLCKTWFKQFELVE